MIIKGSGTKRKIRGPMTISEYSINSDYSSALIEINGNHGKIKCINEDRIYFIISGKGIFVIDKEEHSVSGNDLIFVPKNTPYNITGKMKYLLICSPAFDPKDDVLLGVK